MSRFLREPVSIRSATRVIALATVVNVSSHTAGGESRNPRSCESMEA